jgi:hypothetical protein
MRRLKMPEPIIIDGHADKVTITVPAAFKLTRVGDSFTVEVEAEPGKPFEEVVVGDRSEAENAKTFSLRSAWHIRIS